MTPLRGMESPHDSRKWRSGRISREGVGRVRAVHHRHADLATGHPADRRLHVAVCARGGVRPALEVERPADVACHRVEDEDRDVRRRGVPVVGTDARPEREARTLGEGLGELPDRLLADPGGLGRARHVVRREDRGVGTGGARSGRDHGGHPERQSRLRSGADREPLVGVQPGEGEARTGEDEAALRAVVVRRRHVREGALVRDRRGAGLDEVVPERDEEASALDVVARAASRSGASESASKATRLPPTDPRKRSTRLDRVGPR